MFSALSYLKNKVGYIQEFIADPRNTGTIAPSSQTLCRAMSEAVDWQRALHIAELGAGDGVLTRHLLSLMREDARLQTFETNPRFYSSLNSMQDRDPRLQVMAKSAENLHGQFDAIFSCLPLLSLPYALRHRILKRAATQLAPGGIFVQFQYTSLSEPLLSSYFAWSRKRVLANLPPAWVYQGNPLTALPHPSAVR
ncbi:class I SAM-dependent methyltransferase [Erwinia piriflorinigrans]|uniref:Putative methyltransferase n=1 Tax=Erwinia piriflorinigrans CFBP 5888 TaxID=1161919 RepID=V5Z5Q3_9GAMM|nr:methyltransferase domain-containing protein [Erwinia piriflorinigrans]CCG86335.1 putative methyltransferase [Erwinia piriflorinigrans CFBP 5888]